MRKFKVGDKVINSWYKEEGIITEVHSLYYTVYNKSKNITGSYSDCELQLVKKESEYPTYDLSIEHYNLSPSSPAIKKEDELKVGDLVYVSWPQKTGLAFITGIPYEDSKDKIIKFIGEETEMEFGDWWLQKDHPAIDKLKEYFNQVK